MLLSEYLSVISETVSDLSNTGLILSTDLSTDFRTEKIGLIKGGITFIDSSKLFFKEYLDLRYTTEKLSYSFHYQDDDNNLIFRYDNALHKPDLGFTDNKHVKENIIESAIPNLREILEEIFIDHILI